MNKTMNQIAVASISAVFIYWRSRKHRKPQKLRPQDQFQVILTDNSDTPFKHLQPEPSTDDAVLPVHPFQQRILQLDDTPPSSLSRELDMPAPVQQSKGKWVASLSDLQEMVQKLAGVEMLAVDVEHHHQHSYLGFVCLVQLSTGEADYLVDALALHDHMHLLRPIFADSGVLKVVHGGNNDVLWLQRDFHIYMVNAFDTERACQVLGRHHRALAKLLEVYCHVTTDKSFQTSDWRIRPLSKAQQTYAQRDAHYLLYLAHVLYQELQSQDASRANKKDKSRVMQAWQRCQRVCMSLYHKPQSQAAASASAANVLRSHAVPPSMLERISADLPDSDPQQTVANSVHALCQWRDDTARQEDEGVQAILPDAVLLAVATAQPASSADLVECVHDNFSQLDGSKAPQDIVTKDVESRLQQHAEQICKILHDSSRGVGPPQKALQQLAHSQLGNANQARQLQTPEQRQASLRARLVKKFSAKSAVYENCKMLSQDGELLCFCDLRKLTWYENRGLAERISDNPPTIKLTFMHKTGDQERGVDEYYLHSKENKCVSCGEEGHYLRYRVVPTCYRRNFPVQWKSHRSHDIVLLCVDCHHIAHKAAEVVKKQLSQEYGVPLFPPRDATGRKSAKVHPFNVRRAAVALKMYGKTLPEQRRKDLQKTVRLFVSGELAGGEGWLSQEELEQGLLAGLAPRQKRRTLRQLAAEKNQLAKAEGDDDDAVMHSSAQETDNDSENQSSSQPQAAKSDSHSDADAGEAVRSSAQETDDDNDNKNDVQPQAAKAEGDGDSEAVHSSAQETDDDYKFHSSSQPQAAKAEGDDDSEALHSSAQGTVDDNQYQNSSQPQNLDSATTHQEGQNSPTADQPSINGDSLPNGFTTSVSSRHHHAADSAADDASSSSQHDQDDASAGDRPANSQQGAVKDDAQDAVEEETNGHAWHGRQIVKAALAEGGPDALLVLIQRFRQSFTEALHPKFLPASWHVMHSADRDFGEHSIYASTSAA